MSARTLMIQGTGSHVGKSFLVAGLCRLFKEAGLATAPFKSQNMALNSFATEDGLEIGRAQATQAQAAGIKPSVYMNPILLKPTSERRAQVIVMGKRLADLDAQAYHAKKTDMIAVIRAALTVLRQTYELIVIEGAGSPAEVNLADRDIANMAVADLADAPVILVADIDKGGAFAAIIGTLELLRPQDRLRVRGFIINKFRGDETLLEPGLRFLEERTGLPVLGVVPHIDALLEAEDSVSLEEEPAASEAPLRLAVPRLPRISNFTDLQPFELLSNVSVSYVRSRLELGHPDAVIIPGSKNTLDDLAWLRRSGLGEAIVDLARGGVPVIGICGGFQMLGRQISDPLGIEGPRGSEAAGLELLPVRTTLTGDKSVKQVQGVVVGGSSVLGDGAVGAPLGAYEIHAGLSGAVGPGEPFCRLSSGATDGWVSPTDPVLGTYMHGLFDSQALLLSFVNALAMKKNLCLDFSSGDDFEGRIKRIAQVLAESIDLDKLRRIIGVGSGAAESIRVG